MAPGLVVTGSASGPFAARLATELGVPLARSESRRFPDGEGYVRILDAVHGKEAVVVQATAPDMNLMELLLWQDAIREAGAERITTVIPYLGYARQDRVFQPGEAISARAAARAVATTTDAVIAVDPHKEESLAFFGGKARSVTAIPQIAHELARWGVDIVLAPDKGARERASHAASLIGCRFDHLEKTRLSPTEVTMRAKDLDVAGSRVAIVDDLIASGATMVTAARQLKAQGATAVYAACTHGLFTGNALPRILAGGIDRVLATDTCISGPCSCDVVSAAPAVAAALRHTLPAM